MKSESETNDETSGGASPSQDASPSEGASPSQSAGEPTAPEETSPKAQPAEPPSEEPSSTDGAAREPEESAKAPAKADDAKVATASEASDDPPSLRRKKHKRDDAEKAPLPPMRRGLRTIYWAVWFVLAPFVLACLFVWAATPPSGELLEGGLSFLRSFVREQPVPVGIASLTFFELAFWMARHRLPLASHAYTPLPEGVAENLRSAFERARTLLDEAESILEANKSTLSRDVSNKERQKLREALDELDSTMRASPFHERSFVDALLRADGEVEVRLGRFRKSEIREYVESIFVAIAVALCLRAFIVEAFKIPSGSMIPTLQVLSLIHI